MSTEGAGKSTEPERQPRHLAIIYCLYHLRSRIANLEGFVARVRDGETTSKIEESPTAENRSLSDTLTAMPAELSDMNGRIEKALSELDELLF